MHRYLLLTTCIILACVTMVCAESFDSIDENMVIKGIQQNHTIFFGEEHLDISACLDGHGYVVTLDTVRNVTDSVKVDDPVDFTMPTDKEENTWYQATDANTPVLDAKGSPVPAFITQEPVLGFSIWNLNTDMAANASVQRGTLLQFKFTTDTNLDDITTRSDYKPDTGYMNIGVVAPDNETLLKLMTLGKYSGNVLIRPTINLDVRDSAGWVWPENLNSQTEDPTGWMTGWRDAGSGTETDYNYKLGNYDVTAVCNVNNMFKNRDRQGFTWDSHPVELTARDISVSATAPSGSKNRDAQFTATVTGMPNTLYEIFIYDECPPKITGKICDRPPYIIGDRDALAKKGIYLDEIAGPYTTGALPVVDCCTQNMTIRQAVPSGDAYPSKGDWDTLEKGTRYYASVRTGPDGTVTIPFWIDTTVKPGTFTIQAQDRLYDLRSTTTVAVSLGSITGTVKSVNGAAGSTFYVGDEIWIDGTNSDSNTTYVWLTGPGLEACGVNLFDPTGSSDPVTTVVYDTKNGQSNYWRIEPNWNTGEVPIGPGEYTLWMASVDSGCMNCQCNTTGSSTTCGFGNCFGVDCEEGVCGLIHCPQCAAVTNTTITLIEPDLTANINDTTRCCCPGYPCGKLGGVSEMWLTGNSGGNSCKQLQVWLFGQSQFGLKNYLMAVTPIYCDGTYKFELNKGLLQANGIDLCSLATGKYDIIVQAPGVNNKFDIRLGEQEKTGDRYVLTTMPTNESKLFKIEGKDSLYAGVALKALVEGLNDPAVDDLYAHTTFELKDKACEGNVDFTADKTQGNSPLNVTFTDTSVMEGVSWSWQRNGVVFSTEQNPKVSFTDTGKYTISLTVTDAEGNTNTAEKKDYINVISSPVGDFSYSPSSPGIKEVVQFTDTSTGGPTSWMWDFGDGATSSLQSPTHAFAAAGTYEVTLQVGNAMGVGAPAVKQVVVVNDKPVAAFSANPTSSEFYPVQVNFTDESTGVVHAWNWEFIRNGVVVATSADQNPTITFTIPGFYSVKLTVANDGGYDELLKENYITIGAGSIFSVSPGWNHVSVPQAVTSDYNTVSKLFQNVNSGDVPYAVFNNSQNKWVDVADDYPVVPLEALRVWKNDPGVVYITPDYVSGQTFSRELSQGWNGIGVMIMQPTLANKALASLGDTWNKTLAFDPATQLWEYPIIRGIDDDKSYLYPTVGYLIEMNATGTLTGGE